MDMVEVDPKLFITCRLCLKEMGQYQIVPQVQMQFKYCFDIEVEPFDGLPQLICKECESILSEYAGKKQMFQEKQKSLLSKLKNKKSNSSNTHHQQDTVSSTQQADSNCNSLPIVETNTKILLSNSRTSSADRESSKENSNVISVKKNLMKRPRSLWKKDYLKHFVCRFCTKSYKEKRSVSNHLKQCQLKVKYANVVQNCFVELDRMGSKPNLTSSNENVVCRKDKIINCRNRNYYVMYTLKSFEKCVSSSDEDFTTTRKHKRRRLISRGSNETLVIEGNISKSSQHSDIEGEKTNFNQTKVTDVSDIECVGIDDSESVSSNLKPLSNNAELTKGKSPAKLSPESEKDIQNVITMCYNKFLKRLDTSGRCSNNSGNIDSCLERKILSVGLRVVTGSGLISTGLIRYMEHKDLDVNWIQKKQTNVGIKTLRSNKNNNSNCSNWKSLKDLDNSYIPHDFIECFEKITKVKYKSFKPKNIKTSITQSVTTEIISEVENTAAAEIDSVKNSNSVLHSKTSEKDKQTMLQNLLNKNPVAIPKQFPKETSTSNSELLFLLTNEHMLPNSELSSCDENVYGNSNNLSMPVITSTISLANNGDNTGNDKHITQTVNNHESLVDPKLQTSVPRIKVKSVSELMSEKVLNQQKDSILAGQTNNWNANYYNRAQNVFDQNENTPVVPIPSNVASCSAANSPQQPNSISLSEYFMNENSSNILVTPCSNTNSDIVNLQHHNQTYVSNRSQSDINTNPSNLLAPQSSNVINGVIGSEHPKTSYSQSAKNAKSSNIIRNVPSSNKSSCILKSLQPNTNYSQFAMNADRSNICLAPNSNASSSSTLYSQQPDINYSQYSMIATSSNIRLTPSTNVRSNISNPQHPNTSYSENTINATTSNVRAMPSCSNVTSRPFNQFSDSQYNNCNKYPKNTNMADTTSTKSSSEKQQIEKPSNQQYVLMNTIDLPWKKTNSPFRYFQELLQIHNIKLLDSIDVATNDMSCLIKFKLVFHQEFTAKVTLCLSLFYCRNTFCITVKDVDSKFLDIAKLSAYWQWEILKEFKGDVVSKLYENASKISPEVLNITTYFVTLLENIQFMK